MDFWDVDEREGFVLDAAQFSFAFRNRPSGLVPILAPLS